MSHRVSRIIRNPKHTELDRVGEVLDIGKREIVNEHFSIVLAGPTGATKPYVVLSSLLNTTLIDWNNSLVILDSANKKEPFFKSVIENNLNHSVVDDPSLAGSIPTIQAISPDFIVSCGWGAKIASPVLSLPKIAALNCHSSFLPDYRGANAFDHYWANCEQWAGATVHHMVEEFDAGRIVTQQKVRVFLRDSPDTILWRISEITSVLLREALLLCANGFEGLPHSGGRYFYPISKRRAFLHRAWNLIAAKTGLPRVLTRHKKL